MQYFFCTTEQKGTVFYNTSSTNSSEHQSCGWDIWSDIPERFQHLSKTIRHRGGALVTASAAKRCDRVFFLNDCTCTVCCCCKSVISWSWQPAKKASKCTRETLWIFISFIFSRENAVGAASPKQSYFTPIQRGCSSSQQHPEGPLLLRLRSTERVGCMESCLV